MQQCKRHVKIRFLNKICVKLWEQNFFCAEQSDDESKHNGIISSHLYTTITWNDIHVKMVDLIFYD